MTEARAELEDLTTDELRRRAFALAERKRDVGFFWDLLKHLPAAAAAADDDPFSGPADAISDLVEMFREMRGEHLAGAEPMLRAKFLDYLTTHGGAAAG